MKTFERKSMDDDLKLMESLELETREIKEENF